MDDQFDKELNDRIREVFDKFEDPSADEGWLLLRKKFPAERKRRPVAWLWAAAAVLMLLSAGTWLYLANNKNSGETIAVKPVKPAHLKNLPAPVTPKDTTQQLARSAASQSVIAKNSGSAKSGIYARPVLRPSVQSPVVIPPVPNSRNVRGTQQLALLRNAASDTGGKKTLIAKNVDTIRRGMVQTPPQQIIANNTVKSAVQQRPHHIDTVPPKQAPKSIMDMFAADKGAKDLKSPDKRRFVRLGVYAATYFNYAKGSNNQANIGAGVTADFRINKHLSIVSGITIGQNSMNFSTAVPTVTAQNNIALFSVPSAAAVANISAAYNSYAASTIASEPSFKNYDANLVALDVPLNLKYDFNPEKNNFYVMAGLSSGAFINESYTYQYNYPNIASPSLQQLQDETTRKNFGNYYFAKTLNFAFGIGYPMGKNRLVFEPFVKYPLDGMGAQNIRFGAGGVNLKFTFENSDKK